MTKWWFALALVAAVAAYFANEAVTYVTKEYPRLLEAIAVLVRTAPQEDIPCLGRRRVHG